MINTFLDELTNELYNNILPFWLNYSKDNENGGFIGNLSSDLQKKAEKKSCILTARILWVFSRAYIMKKDDKYLKMANYAYDTLINKFLDKKYGGVFWTITNECEVLSDTKQSYAHAFCIYGLSEFYEATKNNDAINYAIDIYKICEKYFYDKKYGGYTTVKSRKFEQVEEKSADETRILTKKIMNDNLHILEAYTNLYRVSKNADVKKSLEELLSLMAEKVVDKDLYAFKMFFNDDWSTVNDRISYGHSIEGSWLLFETANVLGNKGVTDNVSKLCVKMAETVLNKAIDNKFSVMDDDFSINKRRDWWVQAEAVTGLFNAYEITGDDKFLIMSKNIWNYIKNNIINVKTGEWFMFGKDYNGENKNKSLISPWKCPYHNSRMCMEIITRFSKKSVLC